MESKILHPSESSEEWDASESRVWLYNRQTVWIDEASKVSPERADRTFDEVEKLIHGLDSFQMVINLSQAGRPDALTRKQIYQRLQRLRGRLGHCAYYTGSNLIITTAIRFVMRGLGLESYSVSATREEALEWITDDH